jgi:23S rRNA (uracil1939-C5)-methyltransferase
MLMPLRADCRHGCARHLPADRAGLRRHVTALVLRHLEPLSEAEDIARLRAFAAEHNVQWWLQPKGPDTVKLLDEGGEHCRMRCPTSASPCRSSPPISRR